MDASEAGEGNLEILVSAEQSNIPTRVQPLGSARFEVSFVPKLSSDHQVFVTFNEEPVSGKKKTIFEDSIFLFLKILIFLFGFYLFYHLDHDNYC